MNEIYQVNIALWDLKFGIRFWAYIVGVKGGCSKPL